MCKNVQQELFGLRGRGGLHSSVAEVQNAVSTSQSLHNSHMNLNFATAVKVPGPIPLPGDREHIMLV